MFNLRHIKIQLYYLFKRLMNLNESRLKIVAWNCTFSFHNTTRTSHSNAEVSFSWKLNISSISCIYFFFFKLLQVNKNWCDDAVVGKNSFSLDTFDIGDRSLQVAYHKQPMPSVFPSKNENFHLFTDF